MSLAESCRFTSRHSLAERGRFFTNRHKSSLRSGEHSAFDAALKNASAVRSGARERSGFNMAVLVPTSRRTGFDAIPSTSTARTPRANTTTNDRAGNFLRGFMLIIIQSCDSYRRSSLMPPSRQSRLPCGSSDIFPGDGSEAVEMTSRRSGVTAWCSVVSTDGAILHAVFLPEELMTDLVRC